MALCTTCPHTLSPGDRLLGQQQCFPCRVFTRAYANISWKHRRTMPAAEQRQHTGVVHNGQRTK